MVARPLLVAARVTSPSAPTHAVNWSSSHSSCIPPPPPCPPSLSGTALSEMARSLMFQARIAMASLRRHEDGPVDEHLVHRSLQNELEAHVAQEASNLVVRVDVGDRRHGGPPCLGRVDDRGRDAGEDL